MKYATKPTKSSKPVRKYKKRYTRSNKSSKSFVKKVQAIIHKDVETKQAYHTLALTAFNSGIDSVGDAIRILPNISNGTADSNRIGDQLRGMKLSLKGHILLSTSTNNNSSNCRIAVRMMIVQPRNYSNIDNVQSNATTWMSTLLKKGATTTNFTGVISDLYAPINSDAIIKYFDKVIYITIPFILQVGIPANQQVSQDLVNATKFFNLNLNMKNKLLKYDTTGSAAQQPMNYAPTFILGYCKLDGSSPDVLGTQVSAAFDSIFDYEDA